MNRRFDGFQQTAFLWDGQLEGLQMFAASTSAPVGHPEVDQTGHLRLGKLMEQFVLYELKQEESVEVLRSNVQVFQEQRTIGELDCLLKLAAAPIHLEIVYKFYLYDPAIPTELERWIGPNRNDSLVLKLHKLKAKQLPLLHHSETGKLLEELGLKATDFDQQVYFKAQLFVPFGSMESTYPIINEDCITGFYIRPSELVHFFDYTFFIPSKLDWPVKPHLDVEWLSASAFQDLAAEQLAARRAPLCWMQSPEGQLQKFFLVWWA